MHRAIPAGIFLGAVAFFSTVAASFNVAAQDIRDSIWTRTSEKVNPRVLPLGDNKYSNTPKVGYVYPCDPNTYRLHHIGARVAGPWIHGSTWDATQKMSVQGDVKWPDAAFTISIEGDRRVFKGNGLPVGSSSGIFPVQETDPAYQYDRNPNPIKPQLFSFSVPLNPTIADRPACTSKSTTGMALDGVPFFSALDSQGRDEIAYEMQDRCGGMPETNGMYHRHALSDCIPHIHENNALVGYALDGFGIFSPYDENGRELTSQDLDECHGTTSPILWDGKKVTMYHYVLTRDFPYTMTCFRGTPTQLPLPPPPPFAGMPGPGGMGGPGGWSGPMPGPGSLPPAPFPGMDPGFMPPPPFAGLPGPGAMPPPPGMGGPGFMPPAGSPRQICEARADHRAATRDQLKAMLQLTSDQQDAWRKFEQAAAAATDQERQSCAALPAELPDRQAEPPLPQRLEAVEKQLAERLERLRIAREAFRSLYDALSPEQRARLDRLPVPAG